MKVHRAHSSQKWQAQLEKKKKMTLDECFFGVLRLISGSAQKWYNIGSKLREKKASEAQPKAQKSRSRDRRKKGSSYNGVITVNESYYLERFAKLESGEYNFVNLNRLKLIYRFGIRLPRGRWKEDLAPLWQAPGSTASQRGAWHLRKFFFKLWPGPL